ncbi:MAG: TonB-dependent receptor [Bacteroidetes bacterium]|jgi:iron complex outermembrane receptor protein|nr:TonB-dependent receptor [Bacteroidota bacterium]
MRYWRIVATGLLVLLLGAPPAATAQDTGRIEGTVVVARDGTAVPGINVVVVGTLYGAVTDAQGRFTIPQLPPGEVTLQVDALGFRPARQAVTVQAGATTRVQIQLRPPAATLDDAVLDTLQGDLQPVARLSRRDLRTGWATDPGQLLRRLPGAEAGRFGPLGLRPDVRGLSPKQRSLHLDGMPLADGDPLSTAPTVQYTDPAFVEAIEVVKGPYALTQGGGALGGVRVRQPQAGQVDARSVQVGYATNVNLWEGAGTWGASAGRWDVLAQGAYRRGSDYEDGNGQIEQGDFKSATVRGQVGVDITPQSRLTVGGSFQDQRDAEEQVPPFDRQDTQSVRGQVRYQAAWATGPLRALDARVFGHRAQHDARRARAAPPARRFTEGEAMTVGGRAHARLGAGEGWTVDVGADAAQTDHRAGLIPTILVEAHRTQGGLFTHVQREGDAVSWRGAARADVVRDVPERIVDVFAETASVEEASTETEVLLHAAVSATRTLSPSWQVSIGLGTAARAPTLLERYGQRLPQRTLPTLVVDGRADLSPERSLQADLWATGDYDRWQVSASAFARRITNYIGPVPVATVPAEPSAVVQARYANGSAVVAGGEVSVAYRLVGRYVVLHGAGRYLWGRDTERNAPLVDVSPPSLRLGLRASAPADVLFLEGTLHLVAEQNRVPDALGARRTHGYVAGDLHLGLRLPRRATLVLGLNNVSSTAYANHLSAVDPSLGARVPEPGLVLVSRLRVSL